MAVVIKAVHSTMRHILHPAVVEISVRANQCESYLFGSAGWRIKTLLHCGLIQGQLMSDFVGWVESPVHEALLQSQSSTCSTLRL